MGKSPSATFAGQLTDVANVAQVEFELTGSLKTKMRQRGCLSYNGEKRERTKGEKAIQIPCKLIVSFNMKSDI